MKFITDGYRQNYAINPKIAELIAAGGGIARRDMEGFWVSSNNSREIDTVRWQEANGYTDETRLMVERHLLSHPDFGMKVLRDRGEQRGDDLLNVQVWKLWSDDIPEEHREFCTKQRWYKAWEGMIDAPVVQVSENTCIFTDVMGQSVMRCTQPALEGQDYCEDHMNEMAVT